MKTSFLCCSSVEYTRHEDSSNAAIVYTGHGVNPLSASGLVNRLKDTHLPSSSIYQFSDSSYIDRLLSNSRGEQHRFTVMIPGGHSIQIASSMLKKRQCLFSLLKNRIASGNTNYLGICAGGNLGCQNINIKYRNSYAVIVDNDPAHPVRTLDLLAVKAFAPTYSDVGKEGKMARISDRYSNDPYYVYWNQGSNFSTRQRDVEILATYDDVLDKPAAVVHGKYGLGHVILTAVHPEVDSEAIHLLMPEESCRNVTDSMPEEELAVSQDRQTLLLSSIFEKLGIRAIAS